MSEPAAGLPFLNEIHGRLMASVARARALTADLDERQLNWKPGEDRWSIAQCLEHILVAANQYIAKLAPSLQHAKARRRIPRAGGEPPRHTLAGKFILRLVEPSARRTMRTPKQFAPSTSSIDAGVVERFAERHEALARLAKECDGLDLTRIKLGTPELGIVRINAADIFAILASHAERHLRQAERVRETAGFSA